MSKASTRTAFARVSSPSEVGDSTAFLLRVPEDKAEHLILSCPDIARKFPEFKNLDLHDGKAPVFAKEGTILMDISFQGSLVNWTKSKRVRLRKYLTWFCQTNLDQIEIVWTLPRQSVDVRR